MKMARSINDWKRLGSEAQGDDARKGHVGAISDADLRSALEEHFDDDLFDLDGAQREDAVCALMEGYRNGG